MSTRSVSPSQASEVQPFRARMLTTRREAIRQRAIARQARTDSWSTALATTLLVATILFQLIGATPYVHERTLDTNTGGGVLSPTYRYIWFGLTGLAVPLLWMRRGEIFGVLPRIWPYLLLCLWFAASTTWALDPPTSQRRWILLMCQTSICVACCLGLRRPDAVFRALATSAAAMVLIDLASWIALPSLSQTEIGLAAIHNHKNNLGIAMTFAMLVSAPYFFTRKSWLGRLFWLFILGSGLALLIASRSKTSLNLVLISLVAASILVGVMALPRRLLASAVAVSICFVCGSVFFWLCFTIVPGDNPLAPLRDVTFTQRTDVWQFVLSEIAKRPLLGAGYGSFWDINPAIQPSLQSGLWFSQADSPTNEAHNGYLDLLVSVGAIGFGLAIMVLLLWATRGLLLLRRALTARDADLRAQIPYLTFLALFPIMIGLHNFLESTFFTTAGVFSFVVIFLGLDIDTRLARLHSMSPASGAAY